jgi:uncharacterized membrane protein (UPF0127 family)
MLNRSGYRILNRTRNTVIADQVEIADSFWARARGLIGRREIPNGFGFAIRPCNGIHTLFMSVAVDVGYVSRDGHIVRILHGIKPWRPGPIVPKSAWVIELPTGVVRATGTQVGDLIDFVVEPMSKEEARHAKQSGG